VVSVFAHNVRRRVSRRHITEQLGLHTDGGVLVGSRATATVHKVLEILAHVFTRTTCEPMSFVHFTDPETASRVLIVELHLTAGPIRTHSFGPLLRLL